ncbi:hypothetical protein N7494_000621 [Penicillium frequentans]|uniref:Uncharacterized protein n=1 Tax=Penicillium frequentans TaxID=3151616 RepID=A0AAD6D6H0_9EURO|nr:hypothetical protein N7494_000621 [Penicillium glabrum]
MPVASRDVYTDITEGLFLLQLPHESQLLASASSSSPLTQSNLALVPPAFPLHIASPPGSANGAYLTLRSTTTATGDPLWPNYILLASLTA